MHKCLDIMLDNESNLTSLNDDERSVESIDERLKAYITSWEIPHTLAREALLKCLESTDFLKIFPHKHNVLVI